MDEYIIQLHVDGNATLVIGRRALSKMEDCVPNAKCEINPIVRVNGNRNLMHMFFMLFKFIEIILKLFRF